MPRTIVFVSPVFIYVGGPWGAARDRHLYPIGVQHMNMLKIVTRQALLNAGGR